MTNHELHESHEFSLLNPLSQCEPYGDILRDLPPTKQSCEICGIYVSLTCEAYALINA